MSRPYYNFKHMETTVPFNERDKPRAQQGVGPERSEGVRKKFLIQLHGRQHEGRSPEHDEAYKKVPQGRFSGFDTNKAFLGPAKTALTIFLKLCTAPYFGPIFLMKNFLDPQKRIMTSFWGSKNRENQFFRPKSYIFHPISTKLSKSF